MEKAANEQKKSLLYRVANFFVYRFLGRPQYDDRGVACVFVHDAKKNFYKKFLYEPFPVESSLHKVPIA